MPKSKEEYRKQYWKGREASRDQVRAIAKILDANETDASKSFAYVLSKYFEEEGDVNVEQEDRYDSAIQVLNGEESTYGEEADLRKTVAKQLRSKARGHGGFSTICDILRLNDEYGAWLEEHDPTDPLVQKLSRFLDEKSADEANDVWGAFCGEALSEKEADEVLLGAGDHPSVNDLDDSNGGSTDPLQALSLPLDEKCPDEADDPAALYDEEISSVGGMNGACSGRSSLSRETHDLIKEIDACSIKKGYSFAAPRKEHLMRNYFKEMDACLIKKERSIDNLHKEQLSGGPCTELWRRFLLEDTHNRLEALELSSIRKKYSKKYSFDDLSRVHPKLEPFTSLPQARSLCTLQKHNAV